MREKLIELIGHVQYLGGLELALADHLIANGVTIPVRCKDCMWLDREDELPDVFRSEQYCYCTEANTYVPINHFCSYGER